MLLASYCVFIWVAEWPPIGKMAAHLAYNKFSKYKYLIVNLVFSHLGFLSGKKVQVGKDQEKAQSERDSHSKNRGGKKQTNNQALIP